MDTTERISILLERIEQILGHLSGDGDLGTEGRARLYDAGMRATDLIREVLIAQEELRQENLDLYAGVMPLPDLS